MDEFVPIAGRLGQLLVETPGGEPHLEFFIEIDFADGEFDDEPGTPFLRINHLRAPGRSWRSLADLSWGGDGEAAEALDATMLLFRVSNPVEVKSLTLGGFEEGGRIFAAWQLVADFESEADRDELEEVVIDLAEVALQLQPLRVSTRLEKQLRGDEAATRQAVAPVVDLQDYGALEKVQGGYAFPPKT